MGNEGRPVALVLGCHEIGSAIAVELHREGHGVVVIDEADPPWARRGMSFTDAWYVGVAPLDGEEAVFCASVRSIPTIVDRRGAIAATTWSWRGVAGALRPQLVVDARLRRPRPPAALLSPDPVRPLFIGVGPGFVAGVHVDVAVETAPGPREGDVVFGATLTDRVAAPSLGGAGPERFVHAAEAGRFVTARAVGDAVVRGEPLGFLGARAITAPLDGVLRGLTARGARVAAHDRLVEVDPRGAAAACFGLTPRARAIACGVTRAARAARAREGHVRA